MQKDNTIPIQLLNPQSDPVTVHKRVKLAKLKVVDEPSVQIAAVTCNEILEEVPPTKQALLWDTVMRAGVELDETDKDELMLLLFFLPTARAILGTPQSCTTKFSLAAELPYNSLMSCFPLGAEGDLEVGWKIAATRYHLSIFVFEHSLDIVSSPCAEKRWLH